MCFFNGSKVGLISFNMVLLKCVCFPIFDPAEILNSTPIGVESRDENPLLLLFKYTLIILSVAIIKYFFAVPRVRWCSLSKSTISFAIYPVRSCLLLGIFLKYFISTAVKNLLSWPINTKSTSRPLNSLCGCGYSKRQFVISIPELISEPKKSYLRQSSDIKSEL